MPKARVKDAAGDASDELAARLNEPTDTLPAEPRAQVETPRFATTLRGYDRAAVDAYVERVTRIVRELEASGSPREAVRQALERVGEETAEILGGAHNTAEGLLSAARAEAQDLLTSVREAAAELERSSKEGADARETAARKKADALGRSSRKEAEELTGAARKEAEELTGAAHAEVEAIRTAAEERERRSREEAETLITRARAEAEALSANSREEADARMEAAEKQSRISLSGIEQRLTDLDAEVDSVWSERQRLIEDIHGLSRSLRGLARDAEVRFPAEQSARVTERIAPEAAPGPGETAEIPAAEVPDAGPERP